MRNIVLLALLTLISVRSGAQTGRLTGLVQDAEAGSPLESATVSIFRTDSSLVTYGLTSKQGNFLLEKLPVKRPLVVRVTYVGFSPFQKIIQLDGGRTDTLLVKLLLNMKDTGSVVITSTTPVRMNGDTLEINPAAFKMKPGAVVEELLNGVPGVTIWSDGTITVNGRKVQNVFVDGRPFMGSTDPRVATQNFPKTAIDKIQLYQEYDRSKMGQQRSQEDSLLTMNIKLKDEAKRGYFGKAGFGYGTSDRFEGDGSAQTYNPRGSIGLAGGINNVNKNIGNIQELFQNNTFRNANPNLFNVGRFGSSGLNRNYTAGGVYTHSFIEAANSRQVNNLTVNYNTGGTDAFVSDRVLQSRTVANNPQQISELGEQYSRSYRNSIGISYARNNSYNDNFQFGGSAAASANSGSSERFTEVRNDAGLLQSTNKIRSQYSGRSENGNASVSIARSDADAPLRNMSLQVNTTYSHGNNQRDVGSAFESLVYASQNTTRNRRYVSETSANIVSASLDYNGFKRLLLGRYNLFGIGLSLGQNFVWNKSTDENRVSDYDSVGQKFLANEAISSHNTRELVEYTPALTLSKNFFKWGGSYSRSVYAQVRFLEDFKTDRYASSIARRNLDRSFQFFRYEGMVNFSHNKREAYQYSTSFNYSRNYDYPTIDQLFPIVDDINAYDVRIGNPALRNRVGDRFNMNMSYSRQKPKALYTFGTSANASVTQSSDPVTDSLVNEASGKRRTYYVNADRSRNFNLNWNANLARKIAKSSLQLTLNATYNGSDMPNYIDGIYNVSATRSMTGNVGFQFALRSVLVFNLAQSLQQNRTEQTAPGLSPFSNRGNTTRAGLVVNAPTNFSFSSTIDRVSNSNLARPTLLWNAFATYRFMKQQAELKFSAMDLLKQYQNIFNSVNSYGTTTRVTNGLQQYFLLTMAYYPRKFGKTSLKARSE